MTLRKTLTVATALAAALIGPAMFVAHAQTPPPPRAEGAGNQAPLVDRPTTITAIPRVIAGGGKWRLVTTSVDLQDGIIGTPDGGLLISHMETNIVQKLEPNGAFTMYAGGLSGIGGLSMGKDGRVYGVLRNDPTEVVILAPERRVIAKALPNGKPIPRPNDIVADGKGGAYISADGAYYINPEGVISTVEDQNIQSNGITLSIDGKTLYVSNRNEVLAFDVHPDGSTSNRRVFADLEGDTGGDGMTVDSANRLYETASKGIHVYAPTGRFLGLIPTLRRPTAVAFSGPGRKTLYVLVAGATRTDGKILSPADGGANLARTLYKMPALATGWNKWAK